MQPYISTNYSQYFLETPLELQFASLHQFYLLARAELVSTSWESKSFGWGRCNTRHI